MYLEDTKYRYEVAAVYITNVARSGKYYSYIHQDSRIEQMEYLKQMEACRLYDTGITLREDDELLSLSTCEYSSNNGRLIVLARRENKVNGKQKRRTDAGTDAAAAGRRP